MNKVQAKESEFHDNWAETTAVDEVAVRASFEAPTALETAYLLRELGDLSGLRILDVGAGLGEASVYFALKGAKVVASDLSPAMGRFQQRLAAHHGVAVQCHTGPAETLDLGGQFDVVYAANLIHHLTDKEGFLAEADRLLKPGGVFVAWDPLRYNPIINVYRRLATEVRTEDERPLGIEDYRLVRSRFRDSKMQFFWLSTQVLFLKYFLFDRKHPNSVRYWKRIYEETPDSLRWWRPFQWLDSAILLRIPGLRWLSWNAVFIGRKP